MVSTLHVGTIAGLRDAYAAIDAWRAAHGEASGGVSWETYGDPRDDPAEYEVRVTYRCCAEVGRVIACGRRPDSSATRS